MKLEGLHIESWIQTYVKSDGLLCRA